MSASGLRAALAVAVLALALGAAAGPASAEEGDGGFGTLVASSPFAPFVIVKAGESFSIEGIDALCPDWFVEPELTIDAYTDEGARLWWIEDSVPVVGGEPTSFDLETTLSSEAVQGTYELVGTCQEGYTGEYAEIEGAAVSEIDAIVGAAGWLVVGDENRLPPSSGTLDLASTDVTIGEPIDVTTGETFAPDSPVEVWLYSEPLLIGAATASGIGAIATQATVPTGTALGAHTMVVAGVDPTGRPIFLTAGMTVGAAVTPAENVTTTTAPVAAAGAPTAATPGAAPAATATAAAGTLPATGSDGVLALVGVVVLLGGLVLLAAARRLRANHAEVPAPPRRT